MISESGGRAVVIAPSALGSKDHPAGPSKVELRRIRQVIYPRGRIRRRNVEKAPWRVSRHDNLLWIIFGDTLASGRGSASRR